MQLQHALRYASMKWFVLPLHYPIFQTGKTPICSCGNANCTAIGKHPALKNGIKGATINEDKIREWWRTYPWNIGIAAGASHIIIIDVDPRNGGTETLKNLCNHTPIPRTLTARTGGGGSHHIFQAPKNETKFPNTLGMGIDIQQGNKYIVAPPSLHASGRPYQWLDVTPPVTPDWILLASERNLETPKIPNIPQDLPDTHIPTDQKRRFAEGCLLDAADKLKNAKPGERQTALNKEAYGMGGFIARKLLDEQEVTTILLRAAPISVGIFGVSDFTLEEAKRTIQRGILDGKNQPRSVGYLTPAVTHNALPACDGSSVEWRNTTWPPDLMDPGRDWTELGLARRSIQILTQKYESDVIFDRDHTWAYEHSSNRWIEIPPHYQTLATIWHGAQRGKGKPLNVTASKLKNIQGLISIEAHSPDYFTKQQPGVCFRNGRYFEGTLHPLSPNDRNMFVIPHTFDSNAPTQLWDDWFSYFWPNKNTQKTILEFLGATLFGITSQYERALMLLGDGDNGKSTLLHMIRGLFQPRAVISINPHNFSREYYRALLIKAQLNIVTEVNFKELIETETVKAIISGEEISAREPAGKVFFFSPKMANILAGNKLPLISDFTHGFRKRFLLAPCNITIPKTEIIPGYHEILKRDATQGFLKRIVEHAETLIVRCHYTHSNEMEKAKAIWFRDSNQVENFALEALSTGGTSTYQQIYNHYRVWAEMNGHKTLTKRNMCRRLKAIGLKTVRSKTARSFEVTLKSPSTFT